MRGGPRRARTDDQRIKSPIWTSWPVGAHPNLCSLATVTDPPSCLVGSGSDWRVSTALAVGGHVGVNRSTVGPGDWLTHRREHSGVRVVVRVGLSSRKRWITTDVVVPHPLGRSHRVGRAGGGDDRPVAPPQGDGLTLTTASGPAPPTGWSASAGTVTTTTTVAVLNNGRGPSRPTRQLAGERGDDRGVAHRGDARPQKRLTSSRCPAATSARRC